MKINLGKVGKALLGGASLFLPLLLADKRLSSYIPKQVLRFLNDPVLMAIIRSVGERSDLGNTDKRNEAVERVDTTLQKVFKVRLPESQTNLLVELLVNKAKKEASKK